MSTRQSFDRCPKKSVRATAEPIVFLPSYVGSKRRWLPHLESIASGRNIVELFAGSAIISATYANCALLVDTDENLTRVLSRYDELDVPDSFTVEDYDNARPQPDWWRSAYYLAAMCRGGIWRSSERGGFNVQARNGNTYSRRPEYEAALSRWRELQPEVRCTSYLSIINDDIRSVGANPLVVLDPPYEGTSPQYVNKFDFPAYWARVSELVAEFDVVIFDLASNLIAAGFPVDAVQNLSGLGKAEGGKEAMAYLPAGTTLALRGGKHVARKSARKPAKENIMANKSARALSRGNKNTSEIDAQGTERIYNGAGELTRILRADGTGEVLYEGKHFVTITNGRRWADLGFATAEELSEL